LRDAVVRRDIFDGLESAIAGLFAERSRAELLERGQEAGLPCSLLNTPAEFVADEQLAARDYFVTVHDACGDVRMPGAPFKSEPPMLAITRAAPRLGEHNEEVFVGELGHESGELAAWREDGLV
jgi:crotonobetainyl-CoA:carnitine CoA-transferase CaiB-like acyl-CoA transferase